MWCEAEGAEVSKEDRFVRRAIHHAAQLRHYKGNPLLGNTIHYSDAGSHYTSARFGETLAPSGLVASVGTAADAFDNNLAETTIELPKTDAVRNDSPFRRGQLHRLTDIELLTAEWVHRYNADRLMHRLGRPTGRLRGHPLRFEHSPLRGRRPITGVHQTRGDSVGAFSGGGLTPSGVMLLRHLVLLRRGRLPEHRFDLD